VPLQLTLPADEAAARLDGITSAEDLSRLDDDFTKWERVQPGSFDFDVYHVEAR